MSRHCTSPEKTVSRSVFVGCLLLLNFLCSQAMAQETKQKATADRKQRPQQPALVQVEEQPGLPRVLLIGDSISMGYTVPVRELLKGKANVIRPLTNRGPTTRGVTSIDEWLGNRQWM